MTTTLIIMGLVLVAGFIWYVQIVGRRNKAREALSSIDVQLRKRHDLIPNILKIAQRFMEHEQELLQNITQLRAKAADSYDPDSAEQVQEHLQAEAKLQSAMGSLFYAVSENYPDLQSSQNMREAQDTFSEVEGHIAAARRFYNATVTDLNNAVQIFPGNKIAEMANVTAMPYFEETDETARQPVDADKFLK